ncbi:DUF5947 family protein [Amycolatopsis acidiphila]|nr:DUF5947 family protein [Amycolatopsis acidiphila]UIJ56495.1 DUF5947 family protein [Amycolatopsis acidiphila]
MTAPLRRFLRPAPRPAPGEQCEMCAEPLSERHSHVIDLDSRAIMCTCRGCYLLFTRPGAGRHRAVPERYLHAPDSPAGRRLRESAGIPVRMAFFFVNSRQNRPVAFYPSPAGATESLLSLDEWEQLRAEFGTLEPDVEALLVNGDEAFLVPIDVCYELVGLVKLHWRGFDGGTEAWEAIDGFFAELRRRSRTVVADGG